MKTFIVFLLALLLSSCFLNKERRQWKSKKFSDDHFFKTLNEPVSIDTTNLKLNQIYICKTDSGMYRHFLFTKDQKVYSSPWTKGPVDRTKIINNQNHCGYYTTRHDTIIMEDIGIINFFTGNGKKGLPLLYRHFKTLAIANNDSLFISRGPSVLKKSEWNDKKQEYFYRPIKYAKY